MDTAGDISPSEKEALAKEFRDLEEIRTREAKSRAVVLEILGDIPDADITPPKNVLFVCKLNPVTEEGDLKIIFSRFGNVKKCDIIKDYVTGDSLQYAFIEFETEESCNEAYFKMQNVLIDDRRIHVDFCQSVSGFWKRYYNNETFSRKRKERSDNRKNDNHRDDRRDSHKRPSTHHHKKHRKHDSEDRGSHRRHDSRSDRDRPRRRSADSDRRSHRRSRDSGKHRRRERSRSSSMDPFGRRKKGHERYGRRSASRSRDRNRRSRTRSSSAHRKSRRSFS